VNVPDVKAILQGPVRLMIGAAASDPSPDVMPPNTLAFGATWPGTWRDVGYTSEDGVTISFGAEYTEVLTAQQRLAVLRTLASTTDTVSATLLEATLQNIRDATGRGTLTTTPPAAGVNGQHSLILADPTVVEYVAIGFEGVAPPNDGGQARRAVFPMMLATGTVDMQNRIGEPTGLPVEFTRVGGAEGTPEIRDVLAAL
jgi:hypothetical protein